MTTFQVARNKFEKVSYDTIETDDVILSLKNLVQPGNSRATEENVASLYGGSQCFVAKAKNYSPYIFPYTMKTLGAKLVKENTAMFSILILDIDNGPKEGKCTIEEFIDIYKDFDYYLYTSAGHSCSEVDKFRVVIPLKTSVEVEELILRKSAIQDMFSIGGFSFVDNSAINRCRGFVVPVATWNFFEYENHAGVKLDVVPMARVGRKKLNFGGKRNTIKGIEKHPEVQKLVELYRNACEDSLITVSGEEYTRNDAFYKIHIEIASYNIGEYEQKALALYMDFDGKRGETPALQTVDNARNVCDKVAVGALSWGGNNKDGITYVDPYIHKDMVPMKLGGINLLTSPPGTGKTTIALGEDLPIIEGVTHKVLFAAPLNSIVLQQAEGDSRIKAIRGEQGVINGEDRIVCSFNALVAIMERNPDLSGYLVIIDECHKVITDGYRPLVMSKIVELTIARSDVTTLYMSGTFDPEFLECVPFDKHFKFGRRRPLREIKVIEVDNLIHGTTQLMRQLKGNTLTLLDDTKKGSAMAEVLECAHVHKDAKDTVTYTRIMEESLITTSVITTQVILEGINLKDCVDNIIIVGKASRWGVDQMVQFYERERIREPNFYFVRLPIKQSEITIRHAKSEKVYQNKAFNILKAQGLDKLKDLGVINLKGLFRAGNDSGGDTVEMNVIYPYVEQKEKFNLAVYQDPERMGELLKVYGYYLTEVDLDNINVKDAKVQEILDLQKETAKHEFEELVINCIKNIEPEDSKHYKLFRLIRNLIEVQEWDLVKVQKTVQNKAKCEAIESRIDYYRPEYEKAIFEIFEVGKSYTTAEVGVLVVDALDANWSQDLRLQKKAYLKLLSRYFEVKYSRAKKTHKLMQKIEVKFAEQIAEI